MFARDPEMPTVKTLLTIPAYHGRMERLRRSLILIAVIAVPAAAHSTFAPTDDLCFASGSATYRLSPQAASPDQLQCAPAGLLARVSLTPQPFSSTALRAQLAGSDQRPDGLPDAVWHYLREQHLYTRREHRPYTHTTPARDGQEAP